LIFWFYGVSSSILLVALFNSVAVSWEKALEFD
jgi:hypothetical protein